MSLASVLVRILLGLVLLSVLGFCLFGFLATFEPMARLTQWIGRAIYGVLGLASLAGLLRLARPGRREGGT